MPAEEVDSGKDHDDNSEDGCETRIVLCTAWAEFKDANKSAASRAAKEKSKDLLAEEIASVESSIKCPEKCDDGTECVQRGGWRSGQQVGLRMQHREKNGMHYVRANRHSERRLTCKCRRTTSGRSTRTDPEEPSDRWFEDELD